MKTASAPESKALPEHFIDIIDVVEEALELSIADLVRNGIFVERHFSHHGFHVVGNKQELLLVQNYLIFNAIEAMDGHGPKVLKIMSAINTEAHSMLITYQVGNAPSEQRASSKGTRCIPCKKNGYCHWLEIAENILGKHGGTIMVHDRPGKGGMRAAIELPIVDAAAADATPCSQDAQQPWQPLDDLSY